MWRYQKAGRDYNTDAPPINSLHRAGLGVIIDHRRARRELQHAGVRAAPVYRCVGIEEQSGSLWPGLLVGFAPVANPAAGIAAVWVVMGPVNHTTFVVPFVATAYMYTIALTQWHSQCEVNIVRDK